MSELKLRFHVPAIPGRPTKRDNSSCAYTQKVRKFADMMSGRGHKVFLYGGGGNDARASAYVPAYGKIKEPLPFIADQWEEANARVCAEIAARKQPNDILCVIAGDCQQKVAEWHHDLICVEYGVGYAGVFADYRVFESYAWMHMVYGHSFESPMSDPGSNYDAVIPNYYDLGEFPFGEKADDPPYLLYLGRMTGNKGVNAAAQIAEAAGIRLVLAGAGEEVPEYGEHVGEVGPGERGELLAGATALLAPTVYVEPFGGAAAEAMLCGTPVLCPDWGAFTETVVHGVTGFRCRTLGEYLHAIKRAPKLKRKAIRDYAAENFTYDAIAPKYEAFFTQVLGLHGGADWNSGWEGLSHAHRYGLVAPKARPIR